MEWIAQLTPGEQLIAVLSAIAVLLLGWVLSWLGALRQREGRLENQLREQERRLEREHSALRELLSERLGQGALAQQERLAELRESLAHSLVRHRQAFDERQLEAMRLQQEALQSGMAEVRKQVAEALTQHADNLGKRVQGLTEATDQRLKEISGQVEKRLNEGFEKTTATFTQVLTHLTRIDEAQKKITELSSNVVSLQEVLADKRSRGAFGEVQLSALVRNVMPESGFA
ncbi:MAG: DNA recombination protein RmuC, partial [Candidatus Thiodiazotropha sp.]